MAAVFLSECRLLSVILGVDDLQRTASTFLQLQIDTILMELKELREHGGAVHLDATNWEHIIKRPFNQIMLQMDRMKQTTLFMRDGDQWLRDVQERICMVLMRALCDTVWHVISCTCGGIFKDCIVDLKLLIESIMVFYNVEHVSVGKLRALQQLCEMSLLQWTTAVRRGTWRGVLSNDEYCQLARIFFADSAMRTAFIKEVINDDDDDD